MTTRSIETEQARGMLIRYIEEQKLPFTCHIEKGKLRSTAQNKLQRRWVMEIAEQLGDVSAEEMRGYCKLTIGVPILREENELFRQRYDEVVKPLPYEQKLAIMQEPLDMPITRFMTTKQKARYLDGIVQHFAAKGIVLTMPDDIGRAA